MVDYHSKEYQKYLREERARRKAGEASRQFEPALIIQSPLEESEATSESAPTKKEYRPRNYLDSGASGFK